MSYRIVFAGQIEPSFVLADVKAHAGRKLNASATQIDRLFSGARVTLKKNLSTEEASRYLSVLTRIGMQVVLENEDGSPAPSPATTTTTATIAPSSAPSAPTAATFDPLKTQIVRTPANVRSSFDPEKTLIASNETLESHLNTPPTITEPNAAEEKTLVVSPAETARILSSYQEAATAKAATPSAAKPDSDLEATLVVSAERVAQILATQKLSPPSSSSAPTLQLGADDMANAPITKDTEGHNWKFYLLVATAVIIIAGVAYTVL